MSVPRLYCYANSDWLDVGLAAGGQGGALYSSGHADSSYRTEIGDLIRDEQSFRYAGMHGEFLELHGVVGRPIRWEGELRVSSSALLAIRAQRDSFRYADGVFLFVDDDDTEYATCTLRACNLGRKQRVTVPGNASIVWLLPYQIIIQQQEP